MSKDPPLAVTLLLKNIMKVKLVCSYYEQTGQATKTDDFLERFQTAFDPPSIISDNHVAIIIWKTSEQSPI